MQESLIKHLEEHLFVADSDTKVTSVSGGSINDTYRISAKNKDFFIKVSYNYDNLLKEQKGLLLLEQHYPDVPEVILLGQYNEYAYLVLEFIEKTLPQKGFWETFAHKLASLHMSKNNAFGLGYNNYIGSLEQSNKKHQDWTTFFREERILPLVKRAFNNGLITRAQIIHAELFSNKFEELFPKGHPSLIHGDLWSGNFMCSGNRPYIFDGAVYYGNREMDIAMSTLFGGFSTQFYDAYQTFFPLEKGWEERLPICNVYPLLVHLNLFGISYKSQAFEIINKYQ